MAWVLISAESGGSVWGASAWLVVGKPPHTSPNVKSHCWLFKVKFPSFRFESVLHTQSHMMVLFEQSTFHHDGAHPELVSACVTLLHHLHEAAA